MQIYWFTKSIPEFAGLPADERRRIWVATRWKVLRYWQLWAIAFAIGLPTGLGLTQIPSTVERLLVAVLVVGLLGVLLRPVEVHLRRRAMRELADRPLSQPQDDA